MAGTRSRPNTEAVRARRRFRAFAEAVIEPRAAAMDRAGEVSADVIEALVADGHLGATVGAAHGGGGLDMVTVGILHEEVGRACSSVRSLLTVHGMVCVAIERWGTAAQRADWLPRLARGEVIGALGLTEDGAGSDAGAIETTATPGAGGHVVTGRKRWITAARVAGVVLLLARTGGGISAFLVPRDVAGLTVVPVDDVLGTRASLLGDLHLDACRLPEGALLGPLDMGLATAGATALEFGRYSVACGCVGIAQACLDACLAHTGSRRQGGAYLKDHQLVRRLLTDMVTNVAAARLLCRQAGELRDAGDPGGVLATWMAKYFASGIASRAASDAVQIHGASGCAGDHVASRCFRDAKVMEIIEGATEIQQLMIADLARSQAGALPSWSDGLPRMGSISGGVRP